MPTFLLLAAYFSSGMAGLIDEVSWTRLLTLQLGRGVVASSIVLATFMGGLALGALAGGRWSANLPPSRALRAYCWIELVVALLAVAVPFELRVLTPVLAHTYQETGASLLFSVARAGISIAVLLLPAMALGATFPLAVRGAAGGDEVGRRSDAGRPHPASVSTARAAAAAPTSGRFGRTPTDEPLAPPPVAATRAASAAT